jgi:hypothetical protein
MFKFIDGLPRDVMAIEAAGKVTHEDYRNTLIAKAELMMARGADQDALCHREGVHRV